MKYSQYEKISKEHIMDIGKMKIMLYYSSVLFKDFPENLDLKINDKFYNSIEWLNNCYLNDSSPTSESLAEKNIDPIMKDIYNILLFNLHIRKDTEIELDFFNSVFNFTEIILFQSIVMNYSRLDAFFNDTIKFICGVKPGIMLNTIDDKSKKNESINEKKITWKSILDMKSYEEIIEYMEEDFIYKMGLKSLKSKVLFLQDKLKFCFDKDDIDLDLLYTGEQYRHCIVHRGGIIDNKLSNKLPYNTNNIGTKIKIDNDYMNRIYDESISLTYKISKQVKVKYFKEESN